MSTKEQIVQMIDNVPENDLSVLVEVIRHFVPWDDIASPDDLEAHEQAMREYAAGETVSHEAINWD